MVQLGWCSSTSKCAAISMAEESVTHACPSGGADWLVSTCQINETTLIVTSPLSGSTLNAGNRHTIAWTGGPVGGRVTIRYWVQDQDSVYGRFVWNTASKCIKQRSIHNAWVRVGMLTLCFWFGIRCFRTTQARWTSTVPAAETM